MPDGSVVSISDDLEVALIAARLHDRVDDLATEMIARYQSEIPEYAGIDESLRKDVLRISTVNLHALVRNVGSGELLNLEEMSATWEGAARRMHQGITLEAFLHAIRIWGQIVWNAILDSAREDRPEEREAALTLAGRVMHHVDLFSAAAASAFLQQARSEGALSERERGRGELIDALLAGHGSSRLVLNQAEMLQIPLASAYAAILIRPVHARTTDDPERQSLSMRAALCQALERVSEALVPADGELLAALRGPELHALYPVSERDDYTRARQQCHKIAGSLAKLGLRIGLGSCHPDPTGVVFSLNEAREAIVFAEQAGDAAQAACFDDILVEFLVGAHPVSSRCLESILSPLRTYDAARNSNLVETMGAYFDAAFSLTEAARSIHVHPNTMVYRLRRIHELTGRDPHDPEDLLVLVLALEHSRRRAT